jgi:hypothetical protein
MRRRPRPTRRLSRQEKKKVMILVFYFTYLQLIAAILTHSLTHSLTPCSRFLFEKLTGSQLAKKFPEFYGNRRFITAFTRTRHLSLCRAIAAGLVNKNRAFSETRYCIWFSYIFIFFSLFIWQVLTILSKVGLLRTFINFISFILRYHTKVLCSIRLCKVIIVLS